MRKLRFGIRIKVTGIIMISVVFVSSVIGVALYNSQVKGSRDEMLRLGATVVKGGIDSARNYLNLSERIKNEYGKGKPSTANIKKITKQRNENLKTLMEHFPDMVKKEKLLDISFLIKMRKDRNNRVSEEYIYFKRRQAGIFSRSKNDNELKSSLVDFFNKNIVTESHLAFATGRREGEKDFVIIGYPVLGSKKDESLYRSYISYKSKSHFDIDSIQGKSKTELRYKKIFEDRVIRNNPFHNYNFDVKNDRQNSYLFYRLMRNYEVKNKKISLGDSLKNLKGLLEKESLAGTISVQKYRKIFFRSLKRYGIRKRKGITENEIWYRFFRDIKRRGVAYTFNEKLDTLALNSFKSDLKGILGIALHRKTFYSDIENIQKEIFNLSFSILIRCLFIAIFFPGFIISAVRKLSAGASRIGSGDFSYRIKLKGNDELGQLADQFNQMAHNLKKAQETELEKQRMESELVTASQIQETLLPLAIPEIDGVELAAYYSSASEAGGDYYDFIKIDETKLAVVVADVSGHGVGSGLVMAMTRTLIHTYLKGSTDLKDLVREINEYLYKNTGSKYFVSMFMGIYDRETGKMKYVSCGHNPSYIVRKGDLKEIPAGGIALGVVGGESFSRLLKTKTVELLEKDLFVQYTDGIPEMMNSSGDEFGDDSFRGVILEKSSHSSESFVKGVVDRVNSFKGNADQHDDVTLITLKIL